MDPPPLLSILYMIIFLFFSKLVYIFRIIGFVAAVLGPLAFASRSARPRRARGPNLTLNMYTNLLKNTKNGHVQNRSLGRTPDPIFYNTRLIP